MRRIRWVLLSAMLLALCLPWRASASVNVNPALGLQRTVSRAGVGAGGAVTLLYRVENTGNVPLTSVRLLDTLCGAVGVIERLECGEVRYLSMRITVTSACESRTTVSYLYNGMTYESTLEPLAIAPASNGLEAVLAVDTVVAQPDEAVALTLTLRNTGNTDILSARATDETLGDLGVIVRSLAPGESAVVQLDAKVSASATYCFTVTARTAIGDDITVVSNAVSVLLQQTVAETLVLLRASPEEIDTGASGAAEITLTIGNETSVPIAGVAVSVMGGDEIRSIEVLPPGTTTIVWQYDAVDDAEVTFVARIPLADGGFYAALSNTVRVNDTLPGNRPDVGELGEIGGSQILSNALSAYPRFIYGGIGFLTLLALVAVLHGVFKRSVRRRRHIARARVMRDMRKRARMDEAEWTRTRPHKAVGGEK